MLIPAIQVVVSTGAIGDNMRNVRLLYSVYGGRSTKSTVVMQPYQLGRKFHRSQIALAYSYEGFVV